VCMPLPLLVLCTSFGLLSGADASCAQVGAQLGAARSYRHCTTHTLVIKHWFVDAAVLDSRFG